MEKTIIYNFLETFFALFNSKMEQFCFDDNLVIGTLYADDDEDEDDKQNFSWDIEYKEKDIVNMKLLCDFLINNSLIDWDKIIVTEQKLVTLLVKSGWNDEKAQRTTDLLCSLKIDMVDDGEKSDFFFVHF